MYQEWMNIAGTDPSAKNWQACLELGFESRTSKTQLTERRHQGPLMVQRPFYPEGPVCHVYLLHPPGGVVAGDQLQIRVNAAPMSQVLLTTPAAGKFYRSDGRVANQKVNLHIATDATLEWLPQETIIYEGAHLESSMTVTLDSEGRFIGWEIAVLGRPAATEGFNDGLLVLSWRIDKAERPILIEKWLLDPKAFKAHWGLQGHSACGTLMATPAGRLELEAVRNLIAEHSGAGVTLIDDLLICRAIDHRADLLREFFEQIWRVLRPSVIGREVCKPRIWAT